MGARPEGGIAGSDHGGLKIKIKFGGLFPKLLGKKTILSILHSSRTILGDIRVGLPASQVSFLRRLDVACEVIEEVAEMVRDMEVEA